MFYVLKSVNETVFNYFFYLKAVRSRFMITIFFVVTFQNVIVDLKKKQLEKCANGVKTGWEGAGWNIETVLS